MTQKNTLENEVLNGYLRFKEKKSVIELDHDQKLNDYRKTKNEKNVFKIVIAQIILSIFLTVNIYKGFFSFDLVYTAPFVVGIFISILSNNKVTPFISIAVPTVMLINLFSPNEAANIAVSILFGGLLSYIIYLYYLQIDLEIAKKEIIYDDSMTRSNENYALYNRAINFYFSEDFIKNTILKLDETHIDFKRSVVRKFNRHPLNYIEI